MPRKIGLLVFAIVLSLVLTTAVGASPKNNGATVTAQTTSTNNGGNTANCGASCDQSHNPTDFEKPCDAVPGNGCHTLPDTPCERGHGGTEIGNKHCGSTPALTILKEQSTSNTTGFTHDPLNAPLLFDFFYRVTVTNPTSTQYTLDASDPLCDQGDFALPLSPSGPQTLPAGGTVVYTCQLDVIDGAGIAGDRIPDNATPGGGPYQLTNTVSVTATPDGGGTPVTLTDTVTANFN
jgi:hypothetical protein